MDISVGGAGSGGGDRQACGAKAVIHPEDVGGGLAVAIDGEESKIAGEGLTGVGIGEVEEAGAAEPEVVEGAAKLHGDVGGGVVGIIAATDDAGISLGGTAAEGVVPLGEIDFRRGETAVEKLVFGVGDFVKVATAILVGGEEVHGRGRACQDLGAVEVEKGVHV